MSVASSCLRRIYYTNIIHFPKWKYTLGTYNNYTKSLWRNISGNAIPLLLLQNLHFRSRHHLHLRHLHLYSRLVASCLGRPRNQASRLNSASTRQLCEVRLRTPSKPAKQLTLMRKNPRLPPRLPHRSRRYHQPKPQRPDNTQRNAFRPVINTRTPIATYRKETNRGRGVRRVQRPRAVPQLAKSQRCAELLRRRRDVARSE
jgi:hypothetical protein